MDLATWCIDLLRHQESPGSALSSKTPRDPTALVLAPLNDSTMRDLARQAMEAAFLLSMSQMALVYTKAGQMTQSKDMTRSK